MKNKKLEGIKGWLLVVTIGLILSNLGLIFLFGLLSFELFLYGENYLIMSASIITGIGVILGIYTLINEFKKKKIFIKLIVILISYGILSEIIFSILLNDFSGSLRLIIINALWILYFLESKRVKNTFIN